MIPLVVVLVLASMLLGAVQLMRAAALKVNCMNNQRELFLAMHRYDALHARLPGWTEPMVPWGQGTEPVPVSWVFPLLPHLDRDDVHRRATTVGSPLWNTPPRKWPESEQLQLDTLHCYADRSARRRAYFPNYVANGGYRDGAAERLGPYMGGSPFDDGPQQDGPASAVFLNRYRTGGTMNFPSQSLEWIAGKDGAANTLLFSENLHAGRWDLLGESTPDAPAGEGNVTFNFINTLDDSSNNVLRVNAGPRKQSASSNGYYSGANSLHSGGVNVVFCDGHTNFISQEIDWKTWSLLFTPDGRNLHTTWPDGQGEVNVFERLVSLEQF